MKRSTKPYPPETEVELLIGGERVFYCASAPATVLVKLRIPPKSSRLDSRASQKVESEVEFNEQP